MITIQHGGIDGVSPVISMLFKSKGKAVASLERLLNYGAEEHIISLQDLYEKIDPDIMPIESDLLYDQNSLSEKFVWVYEYIRALGIKVERLATEYEFHGCVYEYKIEMPPLMSPIFTKMENMKECDSSKTKEKKPVRQHEYSIEMTKDVVEGENSVYYLNIRTTSLDALQDIYDRANERIMEAQMEEE